jgi:hypothetical protein
MYIYDLAFANNGQSSYSVNSLYFTIITASNSVYNTALALAIQQNLPAVTLSPGQKTSGQIAFQIPSSETPAKLEYKIPYSIDEFVTNLPTPTSFVSRPSIIINTNLQGTSDLTAFPSIQNMTYYFYTGQTIAITLALSDYFAGTTVTVNSITTTTTGLSISQISPSLPVKISGNSNGNEVDVMVYMLAPPTSFSGTITLNVTGTG